MSTENGESGPTRVQWLVFAALAIVFGVGIVMQVLPDDNGGSDDATEPASVEVEPGGPTNVAPPGNGEADPPGVNAPDEVKTLAGNAVELYTEWSYRDSGPNDWMTRLAKVSTEHYITTLKEFFSDSEPEAKWTWQEVERDQKETRTTIIRVEQSTEVEGRDDRFVMVVTYETSQKTRDSDWGDPEDRLELQVHVVPHGKGWAVDDILSMDNLPEEDTGADA